VHVRTDDDIYRVDSVWLGPPRATFPWRVRYVGYGVGLLVMVTVMFVQRRLGIGLDFFSAGWALVVTVVVTRFVGSRINYDRPLGQLVAMFGAEVKGPRRRTGRVGGQVRSGHVRVRPGEVAGPPPKRGRRAGRKSRVLPEVSPTALPAPWAPAATRQTATRQTATRRAEPWQRSQQPEKGRGRRASA